MNAKLLTSNVSVSPFSFITRIERLESIISSRDALHSVRFNWKLSTIILQSIVLPFKSPTLPLSAFVKLVVKLSLSKSNYFGTSRNGLTYSASGSRSFTLTSNCP
jgi:hypothetical protein